MSLQTPSVDPESPPARASSNRAAPELGHAIRVLLVDDSERNLAALAAMLGDLDASLVKARSGEEALRSLLQQDFALILLDVRMPGLDGFETAALIRSRDRSRHTPIIFLTAYEGEREQEKRGYALGAVDFMSKPVVPEVLRGKVAALIELHRKNEELHRQAALLQEAERREHARQLEVERRRWREEALQREMERERAAAVALQRSNARLAALSDAASELLRDAEPLHAAPRLFGGAAALGAELGLWYAGSGALRLAAHAGLDDALARAVAQAWPGDALVGRAAAERRPVVMQELQGGPSPAGVALALGARAGAAFPLLAGGRLHGVLAFATRARDALEDDDVAALSAVADHVAAALERARLVAELSRSAAELREADARKDMFLAMLGHELRNPLAPVLNAVKLVQRRGGGDPALERVVAAAGRQISHMTRLLDDLLDVSRIRNGKIELKRTRVDLARVVSDALQAAEPLVQERRHTLEVSLPEEPIILDGDPVRLAQVVGNLVQNSAKYTDRGGHLSLSVVREGDEAVLRVRDDGIGISPEMLSRVFDMFVQVEQGSDRAHGGLGLGLTLVKSLVELHGGTVVARSAGTGLGSEFEVRLPASRGAFADVVEGPAAEVRGNGALPAAQSLQIVLVEDNADIRESLRALLELSGHTVEEAEDGRSGIDLIRARRPNVALVDIGLPGMDGYEVARELRDLAGTRLIAMTGYGRPEDRQLALDSGFHAHLVKPVDFDDLTKLLAEP